MSHALKYIVFQIQQFWINDILLQQIIQDKIL
jgi:hypothetical protein